MAEEKKGGPKKEECGELVNRMDPREEERRVLQNDLFRLSDNLEQALARQRENQEAEQRTSQDARVALENVGTVGQKFHEIQEEEARAEQALEEVRGRLRAQRAAAEVAHRILREAYIALERVAREREEITQDIAHIRNTAAATAQALEALEALEAPRLPNNNRQ